MKHIFLLIAMLSLIQYLIGQNTENQTTASDTVKYIQLSEVEIISSRIDVPLSQNPVSTSIVNKDALETMPKTIAADEALRLVPGVRIDNQADGSRIHLSMRGQGILSERGIRIMIDGLPVNDPSGFAPDMYDVDWATVKKNEVMRGPVASLYGSGGNAGVINITTDDGGTKPLNVRVDGTGGSYGELNIYGKNLTNVDYIAFTEPDPDLNSYQPAAKRQFYIGFKLFF